VRIIGGELRSRRIASVPGMETRPTPDRLRETLFNVLAPRIEGTVFVDLYAGTGAVGIEALSRGAARAIFVERGKAALDTLRANITTLGLLKKAEIRQGKAAGLVHRIVRPAESYIVFLDPPYEMEQEYELVMEKLAADAPGLVIAQHSKRYQMKEGYGVLRRTREIHQGDNVLSFYEAKTAIADSPTAMA
jgi:16S rRNA (guanine966-N2)-methyltransferase